MNTADAEEYTESLGQIVAGSWRQVALAQRLGVPKALGLTTRQWVDDRLGGYVRLSIPERREAVAELVDGDGMSQREAADVLGVDVATVNRDRVADATPSEPEPRTNGDAAGGGVADATPLAHVTNNSGEIEWFTPVEYIDAARTVLGGIDLDPASTAEANEVIKAERFYTETDDGLTQEWAGRVWMNPPYAQALIGRFCRQLASSYRSGTVPAACALVNNATETSWFQTLARTSSAICFPKGRIRFWYPGRASFTPLQGQAVLYLGQQPGAFADEFRGFGTVVRR